MAKFGRAKITDVAREAGVSTATVDRVLNRRIGVRAETSERVWSVVARMNAGKSSKSPIHFVHSEKSLDFLVPAGAGPSVEENLLGAVVEAGDLIGSPPFDFTVIGYSAWEDACFYKAGAATTAPSRTQG